MEIRTSLTALLGLVAFSALGCSGSGSSASAVAQPGCVGTGETGATGLCLVSCNLGCSLLGCSITDIAQNQPIVLGFNQNVDPQSVSNGSFSLRTAAGSEPVGSYLVSGTTVTFVPEIKVVGGASFFGFEANETYTLTLPGGVNQANALRASSGDALASTSVCNLTVSRGVIDLDGDPPVASLRSPSATFGVDPNSRIVLEFSEIIDVTPFLLSATTGEAPIDILAAKTRRRADGTLECDPTEAPVPVRGLWSIENDILSQISTATFTPSRTVPEGVCMIVSVTPGVRDLAGTPSQGQVFNYFAVPGTGADDFVEEDFSTDAAFDRNTSSGVWSGGAKPGSLGWDGFHGEFRAGAGTPLGSGVFLWNTDQQVIPANQTLSGLNETVTDGVFRFSKFVIPGGVTVRFIGSKQPQIFVRGVMSIEGTIDLSGESTLPHDGSLLTGGPGGVGGAGAGDGGVGADAGDGIAHQPIFDGGDGDDLVLKTALVTPVIQTVTVGARVPGLSKIRTPRFAVAGSATHGGDGELHNQLRPHGTGGRGSRQFPVSGNNDDGTFSQGFASGQVAAGGGGGGYLSPGGHGVAVITLTKAGGIPAPEDLGPMAPGGEQLGRMAFPPQGVGVVDYFMVGGSGGGGAGSHIYRVDPFFSVGWRSGAGGGGGGGAIAFRVGNSVTTLGTSQILANGGGASDSGLGTNHSSTGGGGSGGTVIFQCAEEPLLGGIIDVRGGAGGVLSEIAGQDRMESRGGDGSIGYLRVEAPGPLPADPREWTGVTFPAATTGNVAALQESDSVTGVQSLWYNTGSLFDPLYQRYEIDATVGGQRTLYSDDSSVGAPLSSSPITIYFQGADEDANGQPDLNTAGIWRQYVGPFAPAGGRSLATDGGTLFRYQILFDSSVEPDITVHKVSVFYQQF